MVLKSFLEYYKSTYSEFVFLQSQICFSHFSKIAITNRFSYIIPELFICVCVVLNFVKTLFLILFKFFTININIF